MRGHAETKKNEQKTEKNNEMHKNILRNCLCVLAGAAVLTIGIMAPKTIFAMMDKSEVDHIYVQQADTSYLDTAAQMTMEEKLDLMDGRSKGMHVSTSYPVENADVYDDYDMQARPAPSRMRALQPLLSGALIGPGTANTSRPCSSAVDAVISAPLRSGASTTTAAKLRPLRMRLRTGKWDAMGSVPGGYSESSTPVAATSS